jgi:hypothetical protein
MERLVQKSAVTGQPSARTSFDLPPMPGESAVFSWELTAAAAAEKDRFFKVAGTVEDQPRSTILFEIG